MNKKQNEYIYVTLKPEVQTCYRIFGKLVYPQIEMKNTDGTPRDPEYIFFPAELRDGIENEFGIDGRDVVIIYTEEEIKKKKVKDQEFKVKKFLQNDIKPMITELESITNQGFLVECLNNAKDKLQIRLISDRIAELEEDKAKSISKKPEIRHYSY